MSWVERSWVRRTICTGSYGSQTVPEPGNCGSRRGRQGEWACERPQAVGLEECDSRSSSRPGPSSTKSRRTRIAGRQPEVANPAVKRAGDLPAGAVCRSVGAVCRAIRPALRIAGPMRKQQRVRSTGCQNHPLPKATGRTSPSCEEGRVPPWEGVCRSGSLGEGNSLTRETYSSASSSFALARSTRSPVMGLRYLSL